MALGGGGARIYNQLADAFGLDLTFAELKILSTVVAVALKTGKEVAIQEGKVTDAIRATISVPGVFLPVELGPYQFVDGGLLINVPVDIVRQMGVDIEIVVEV